MKNLLIPQTMFEVLVTPQKTNLWPLWTTQRTQEWTNKTNRKLLSRNWNTPSWREEKGSLIRPRTRSRFRTQEAREAPRLPRPLRSVQWAEKSCRREPWMELPGAVWSSGGTALGTGAFNDTAAMEPSPCIHLLISNLNKFICSPRWNWMSLTVWGERLVFFILGGVCHWCPIWGE